MSPIRRGKKRSNVIKVYVDDIDGVGFVDVEVFGGVEVLEDVEVFVNNMV